MIQPVNTLTPKVFFKGETSDFKHPNKSHVERNIAVINASGISVATGAVMTAVARSYTNTWKHAGLIGLTCGAITMMFIAPRFLYKAGVKSHAKQQEVDVLIKDNEVKKKLLNEVSASAESPKSEFINKIKNMARKSV